MLFMGGTGGLGSQVGRAQTIQIDGQRERQINKQTNIIDNVYKDRQKYMQVDIYTYIDI